MSDSNSDGPRVHELKTWPQFFDALVDGRKKFEIRENDRGFAVGDTLVLKEFLPFSNVYTGREIRFLVSFMLTGPGFGLADGYSILSLAELAKATP
jgi:hypothetical protein